MAGVSSQPRHNCSALKDVLHYNSVHNYSVHHYSVQHCSVQHCSALHYVFNTAQF